MARLSLLTLCDTGFTVRFEDSVLANLIGVGYGHLLRHDISNIHAAADFQIEHDPTGEGYVLSTNDVSSVLANDVDDLLFEFDKSLTIALQWRRPDLFFIHGAVLGLDGRAAVFSAPSGTGKSTAAWAMIADGFDYLSDELAPMDVKQFVVHPYPHALCLKSHPPQPYKLPSETLNAGRTLHVPTSALPGTIATRPMPVAAFFFLSRAPVVPAMVASRLSTAATAAHLVSNALNSLAHTAGGLETGIALAEKIPGYALDTGNLPLACKTVRQVLGAI